MKRDRTTRGKYEIKGDHIYSQLDMVLYIYIYIYIIKEGMIERVIDIE